MEAVTSADGTRIAYERAGAGTAGEPVWVLVGGAFNDRTSMAALRDLLAPRATVLTYDRRGRGGSGDSAPPCERAQELADLAAVLAVAGGPAAVFGHSSGAVLSLEATMAGLPITRLVLYEPSYIADPAHCPRPATDLADRLAAWVAAGERGAAVAAFLVECVGVPAGYVAAMRRQASWAGMQALAHTLPREMALHGPGLSMPADRLARIGVPALLVDGGNSGRRLRGSTAAVADLIPGARRVTLAGQDHGVLRRPGALAPLLLDPAPAAAA